MINNEIVKLLAEKYGFDECEITNAEPFLKYKEDLDYNNYGEDFNIKHDPKECMADTKNIIVLIKPYKPYDKKYFSPDHIYVDSYYTAANESYFNAKKMTNDINELAADDGFKAMFSPDIPFRHCAIRAGLGKRGINGLLISEKYGSYMHIQCILTNIPLEITANNKKDSVCNDCENCVAACSTKALDGTGKVELKKCIRHYMPGKRYVPIEMRSIIGNSFIGCMLCREACVYNRNIEHIKPPDDLLDACYIPTLADTNNILYREHLKTLQQYLGKNEVRPLKLMKSIVIVIGNTKDKKYIDVLGKIRKETDSQELIEYIDWAAGKISIGDT